MNKLEIVEKDIDLFFQVPFEIYDQSIPYVSPLKSDLKRFLSLENPLFQDQNDFSYFTVLKNKKPVGRLVSHIHRASLKKFGWKRCQFGFFDCEDNFEVAKMLFEKAEGFARSHFSTELVGNFNLTANQPAGVVTTLYKNYHYVDQIFGPTYLSNLLERLAFKKFFPMKTYEIILDKIPTEMIDPTKFHHLLNDSKYKFEKVRKSQFNVMAEAMLTCLNEGFQDNPMAVPLTMEEIHFQAKDLMMIVDEDLSCLAYYDQKPIGAFICIPDLNPLLSSMKSRFGLLTPFYFLKYKLRSTRAAGIFYAVIPEFQKKGINGYMLAQVAHAMKEKGYKSVGGTWISPDNIPSIRQMEKLGGEQMHELHLYRKEILL